VGSRYDDELWELVLGEHEHDHHAPREHLRDFVRSLGRAERALDLGCGDGRLTAELAADELTAADVSAVALDAARRRLWAGVRFAELEPDAPLPFDDSTFDLVLSTETIEHVRDVQFFLSEIRRVLRPGGTLALTTPAHLPVGPRPHPFSPHLHLFTRGSLRQVLDALGFEVASLDRRAGTLLVRALR
jgi:SAM-dependent methyltransferase